MADNPFKGLGLSKINEEESIRKHKLKLAKLEKENFKAMKEAQPSLQSFAESLKLFKPLEPIFNTFSSFLNIMYSGIQEGMADSIEQLVNTLFTQENIANMRELGVSVGDLIGTIVEAFIPAIGSLLPLIELLTGGIQFLNSIIDTIIFWN
jgi:hypothetical protein